MNSFSRLTNEKELLTLLREDNEAAFTQLYNLYWKRCFYTAAQKLQNLYEAEEVVQDIFLNLWSTREKPARCKKNFNGYLFRAAK